MATGRQIITNALTKMGVIQANEVPTASEIDVSLNILNTLIDSKSNEILNTHQVIPLRFPLVAGQNIYELGPTGDWVTERPMRLEKAKLIVSSSPLYVPPVVPSCALVQSQLLDSTMALWHFDETDSQVAKSAVDPDNNQNNFEGSGWSINPAFGACHGSLLVTDAIGVGEYPFGEQGFGTPPFSPEAPRAQTWEIAVYNNGTTSYTTVEFGRSDIFTYAGGEGVAIMRLFVVDAMTTPTFQWRNGSSLSDTFASCPLPVGEWTILCWEWDLDNNLFYAYCNGTRVCELTVSEIFGGPSDAIAQSRLSLFGGSAMNVDEMRQSGAFLYPDATYVTGA